MIKIAIDQSVKDAVKQVFNKANSAEKALTKYICVLEEMLDDAEMRGISPYDHKLDLFPISLHKLANKSPQLTSQKIRLHSWLEKNNCSLIKVVEVGSPFGKFAGYSKIKLSPLTHLTYCDDREDQKRLFEKLHPNFDQLSQREIEDDYDFFIIDLASLNQYIQILSPNGVQPQHQKPRKAYNQANRILITAMYKGGYFYQKRKLSNFGRTYYSGLNVQNVSKDTRAAMLGKSYEYDIISGVVTWKLGYAQACIAANKTINGTVATAFPICYQYVTNKSPLIDKIRMEVFPNVFEDTDKHNDMIKRAMTALNFGARLHKGNFKGSDHYDYAMGEIFTYADECNAFTHSQTVKDFVAEQCLLDKTILKIEKTNVPSSLPRKKQLAYLYQHAETEVMNVFREIIKNHNFTILANIHDAIVLKQQLPSYLKNEIIKEMQDQTHNPFWNLKETELRPAF
jgi:hypothetical protein